MAFNAGAIEATLTVNRNPFTAGLAAARNQARQFAKEKYEATARIQIDTLSFDAAKKQLDKFAKESRTATARVLVERLAFDKLIRDLRDFGRQTYTATARVNTGNSTRELSDLTDAIGRAGRAADSNGNSFTQMGDKGNKAFTHMHGAMKAVMLTLPALLPVAGSAITGVIGLVGALTSALVIAGAGAAAFGLVAIPVYTKISDALKLAKADFDKLPAGIRAGAIAMKDMQFQYDLLVKNTQNNVGFALAAGMNAATAAIRTFTPVINKMGEVLTTIGKEATVYFSGAHWQTFVNFLTNNMVPIWTALWDIIKFTTRAVLDLTVAFGPMATWLLQAIAKGMKDFSEWASKLANDPKFIAWVELAKQSLEAMWKFLIAVVEFLFKLSAALAPVGNVVLNVLTMIFNALNKMPPEWLSAIAMGIAGIFTAMMLGATGPVALGIGAVIALAAALATLYQNNEEVRRSVDALGLYLTNKFAPIWDTLSTNFQTKVLPAWNALVDLYKQNLQPVLTDLGKQFDEKIWPVLNKIADTLTGKLIPSFLQFLKAIEPFVTFMVEQVGKVAVDALWLLLRTFETVLALISSALQFFMALFRGDWRGAWEEIKKIFHEVMDLVEPEFQKILDDVETDLKEEEAIWKEAAKKAFQGILDGLAWFRDEMLKGWEEILKWIEDRMGVNHGTLKKIWEGLMKDLQDIFQPVIDFLKKAWHDFWALFESDEKTGTEAVKKDVEDHTKWWRDTFGPFLTEIQKLWKDFWGLFQTDQKTGTDNSQMGFLDWITKVTLDIVNFIADIIRRWNEFWDGVNKKFTETKDDIQRKWDAFWVGFLAIYNNFTNTITTAWNVFWDAITTKFTKAKDDIQAKWNAFWAEVDRIRKEVWANIENGIRDSLANIQRNVDNAVEGLKRKWRELANAFRDPINWVIRVVINKGILDSWNTVMGWIGQPGLGAKPVGEIPGYAQGGPIKGGVPGRDSVPILTMPGEYVLSKRAVDNLGGLRAAESFHRNAKGSSPAVSKPTETETGLLGFQAGGAIWQQMWDVVRKSFGNARLTSAFRPGDPGYHGKGKAIDIAGPRPMDMPLMLNINRWIASTYGASAAELIHTQLGAQNLLNGRPHAYNAQTQADHVNHVHWATNGLAGGSAGGGLAPIQIDMWSLFGAAATALFNKLKNIPGIPGAGSAIGDAAGRIPGAMIPKVIDALRKKLEKIFTTVAGNASPNAGSMAIQGIVDSVAKGYGWGIGSSQWNALSLLLGKESSWNPNAQNPTSTAYGLFQFLDSTWGTVGATKTSDPRAQTVAGLKYIQQRYGSPSAALAFHRANNWYDAGGLMAPGATMALNGTGQPEAVLTAPQWDAVMTNRSNDDILRKLDQLIEVMERNGGGDTVNINGTKDPAENARRAVLALKLQRR